MTISLRPETQKLLDERLNTGEYTSADDAICAALQALRERDQYSLDEKTRDAIDRAEDQIERGEVYEWKDIRDRVRDQFLGK